LLAATRRGEWIKQWIGAQALFREEVENIEKKWKSESG